MYAILRIGKLHTLGDVAGMGRHNERDRATPNADPTQHRANERLAGTGDWVADVQNRLAIVDHIRSNAVLVIEHVLTTSPEWFRHAAPAQQQAWVDRSMAWLRATYGAENVVGAVLHRDETTPHIQAAVVPIDSRNHLNARGFIGGERGRLSQVQDSYAAAVRDLGLERGLRGSVATHQTVKAFYSRLEEPARTAYEVTQAIQVEPPSRVMRHPVEWAEQQTERVKDDVARVVTVMATKAQEALGRAERAEGNAQMLQTRLETLERSYATLQQTHRALTDQMRQVDLPTVLRDLGATQDRRDTHKWHTPDGHVLTVTGAKFYDHTAGHGSGGAIDLVMHVQHYSYSQAVGHLRDHYDPQTAYAAVTEHTAEERHRAVAQAERVPFRPPEREEKHWAQVRTYLVQDRHLPAPDIDALHRQGHLYADQRGNAVFLRWDEQGQTTGASLRGTAPGSTFKGLVPGTRREDGYFSLRYGEPAPYSAPTLVLVESPIDALSYRALHPHGIHHVIATDGTGALPHQHIAQALAQGWTVQVAVDDDPAGAAQWQALLQHHGACNTRGASPLMRTLPPSGKDWNEALQQERTRQQEPDRDHDRGR